MIQYYANRAAGGAAAVVTEPLNASRNQHRAHYARVWNDDFLDELTRWAAAVEVHDCRLLGQIQDSGRGRHERGRNAQALGVSALADDLSWTVPHVMEVDEIAKRANVSRCTWLGRSVAIDIALHFERLGGFRVVCCMADAGGECCLGLGRIRRDDDESRAGNPDAQQFRHFQLRCLPWDPTLNLPLSEFWLTSFD